MNKSRYLAVKSITKPKHLTSNWSFFKCGVQNNKNTEKIQKRYWGIKNLKQFLVLMQINKRKRENRKAIKQLPSDIFVPFNDYKQAIHIKT